MNNIEFQKDVISFIDIEGLFKDVLHKLERFAAVNSNVGYYLYKSHLNNSVLSRQPLLQLVPDLLRVETVMVAVLGVELGE